MFFPLSAKATSIKWLAVVTLLYIAISAASGFLLSFVSPVPFVGQVFGILSQLIDFYCLSGIVVAMIICFKV